VRERANGGPHIPALLHGEFFRGLETGQHLGSGLRFLPSRTESIKDCSPTGKLIDNAL